MRGEVEAGLRTAIEAFVTLARLTPVLSNTLDRLYTVRASPCMMSAESALMHASRCQEQLNTWLAEVPLSLRRPGAMINNYQAALAYYGIAVSIQRAVFACVGGTTHYDRERELHLYREVFSLLESLLQEELTGLWLSYCKANLGIIGSFFIVALLSSTDDQVYSARYDILRQYCQFLGRLDGRYAFGGLPKLRFNLLLQRLPQQRIASGRSISDREGG
ncbi:uncharacterized protein LTR77_010251 [Saxophila tyrrhenica]|uniref:Uncharacterized protein n=1 Tax=Saxophila tyrrhenica TaxID=1690608 RepID=A0AAV9NYY5_9PEZI|nr:hypothetical protein LTR77_010251 [Saxophila tyrrhenica]